MTWMRYVCFSLHSFRHHLCAVDDKHGKIAVCVCVFASFRARFEAPRKSSLKLNNLKTMQEQNEKPFWALILSVISRMFFFPPIIFFLCKFIWIGVHGAGKITCVNFAWTNWICAVVVVVAAFRPLNVIKVIFFTCSFGFFFAFPTKNFAREKEKLFAKV